MCSLSKALSSPPFDASSSCSPTLRSPPPSTWEISSRAPPTTSPPLSNPNRRSPLVNNWAMLLVPSELIPPSLPSEHLAYWFPCFSLALPTSRCSTRPRPLSAWVPSTKSLPISGLGSPVPQLASDIVALYPLAVILSRMHLV